MDQALVGRAVDPGDGLLVSLSRRLLVARADQLHHLLDKGAQGAALGSVLLAALLVGACTWAPTSKTADDPQSGFRASLEVTPQMPTGESTQLRFTPVNESDARLYLLRWYTPLEGIAGEILIVKHNGKLLPYRGILASRVPPTPDDYVALEAGMSVSVVVDLAEGYDLSEPGEYSVKFLSPRISHVARSEAEMATTMEELGPVQIPAHEITFTISGG
jgi:hypothetical protein